MKLLRTFFAGIKFIFSRVKQPFAKARTRVLTHIDKNPYRSFFIFLGLFLLLIIISNVLGSQKPPEKKTTPQVKQVRVYTVGSAPKLTVQAQVEKSGVVQIVALMPGVVQTINKQVGETVNRGNTLFTISSNYQGGNSSSLQRQLAQKQYQNAVDTFDLQKDIIRKQRDLAEKNDAQADELRSITDQSLADTNALIDLNGQILTSLDQNIANLEATNTNGVNDALILSTKQLKSQFLAANNQAKQASRSAQFTSASDKPPAQLSDLQKELTLKQLDLQDKMLELNREVSRIQLQIAQVMEAMMFPSAPFNGTVQRVFVKVGQQVNPGTPLMLLSEVTEDDPVTAIAFVPADIAKRVSHLEPSAIHIGTSTFTAHPLYITSEAIQGSLYGVYFAIPDQYGASVTEDGFIQVDLPIGYFDTASVIPYIPIDAVYQTSDQSYVFVVKNGKAAAKQLEIGSVYGSFVEVIKGLDSADMIITDRNVIAGDAIKIVK